jgi:hypothetical protein
MRLRYNLKYTRQYFGIVTFSAFQSFYHFCINRPDFKRCYLKFVCDQFSLGICIVTCNRAVLFWNYDLQEPWYCAFILFSLFSNTHICSISLQALKWSRERLLSANLVMISTFIFHRFVSFYTLAPCSWCVKGKNIICSSI